jgi:formamidopyrimidine-DNA glycosylase
MAFQHNFQSEGLFHTPSIPERQAYIKVGYTGDMPSLPELEVYKQQLTDAIVGLPITQVEATDFRVVRTDAAALDRLLVGSVITSLGRYGKWLYADTGLPEQLIIHLGLTGKLRVLGSNDDLPRFTAFVIHFNDGRRLVLSDQRHLGKIMVREFAGLKAEKKLGPDALTITEPQFLTALNHTGRGVRDILMDQKLIAGIGGKYADEILWQAKINPHTKAGQLTEADQRHLYKLNRDITTQAIALGAEVDRFPADWLIPHRHGDKVCPRCHGPLEEHSSTVHCPRCQPDTV